jgi:hypothetical protein
LGDLRRHCCPIEWPLNFAQLGMMLKKNEVEHNLEIFGGKLQRAAQY